MAESFLKDWNASKSQNNNGAVPFYRPIDLTPEEKEQACKNIGVASNDAIERLEDEFIDLRGDMATVSSDVASAVIDANSAVSAANDALSAANAALSSVSSYSTDLAAVSAKADANSANISALSGQVATNVADIAAISGKNTVQDNKIGELSSSVAGLTNSAVYHEAVINNLTTAWTAFSAAEDAVITAATAAIPGQVSAEVSGQLSGKQDKLTTANAGVNISISNAGKIDVKNGGTCVAANGSVAIGYSTTASGVYALSHGESTYAGPQAHAEGLYTSAMASKSHTEGDRTIATGSFSHAEGERTSAVGQYSHTEGSKTIANGQYAHAEGQQTNAIGNYSHAEGWSTTANGNYSHTEGYQTYAVSLAHAEGCRTITDTLYQHVEGQYNAPATGALHVIGNGTSTAQRSNIVETYTSGVNVNGNLIASGVNIIENMNTMAALPTVYSGAQNIVISPVDRDNFEMIKNAALSGTNATFNYYNNKLYVNMDTFTDGNNTTPRFYVNGSNKHCTIERFNIDTKRIYSLFRGSSIIIDEIKEWGKYIVSDGYNYCPFYYTIVNKLPATWEGFSGWPTSIASRMFQASTFKDIPTDYTNTHLPYSAANYNFSYMFTNNVQLSGGAVEFMDWVLAEESANNRTYIKNGCFAGCTAIPNYNTLTADSKYSAFF